MKYGLIGAIVPKLLNNVVYGYTEKALPNVNIKEFKRRHKAEYMAMVKRTPAVGGIKENMLCSTMYIACYGFAYYKAAPKSITEDIFAGMIKAVCESDKMKKAYKGKNAFDPKQMEKYQKGAARSQRGEYPMDWKFTFSWNPEAPEYYLIYSECGVCKIAAQEKLQFLVPYMCAMDYAMIELKGAKLLRTQTLGNGGDCCDFYVCKKGSKWDTDQKE